MILSVYTTGVPRVITGAVGKGQGTTKVIMVCDTPPYVHVPTYQISLTYLERQKCYGPDKKILNCFLNSIIQLIMCNLLLYRWPH
jgi:hypothetical protein